MVKSRVWDYFLKLQDGRNKCNLCNKILARGSRGSTHNLISHLTRVHPKEYVLQEEPPVMIAQEDSSEFSFQSNSMKTEDFTMQSFFEPEFMKLYNDNNITKSIMEMICMDSMPMTTSDRAGFKRFMTSVCPDYELKSPSSMISYELPKLYQEYEDQLRMELNLAEHVVLSVDIWSDKGSIQEMIGVTGNFLKNEKVVRRTIGVINYQKDVHNGVYVAAELDNLMARFNLNGKVEVVCRDYNSIVENACDHLKISSVNCFNQQLHLAACEAKSKIGQINRVLLNCKLLVKNLKNSSVTWQTSEKIQSLMEIPNLCLNHCSDECWCFLQEFFGRVIECQQVIEELQKLQSSDWDLMRDVVEILAPLSKFSKLSESKESSASVIIPYCDYLVKAYESTQNQPEAFLAVKEHMERELHKYTSCQYLKFSTLLDPRYKDLYTNDSDTSNLIKAIETEFETMDYKNRTFEEISSELCGPAPKSQKLDFDAYIQEKIKSRGKHNALTGEKLTVRMEVTRYLSTAVEDVTPRDFWLNDVTKASYPRLAKFARRFIICPTGSSAAEKLFSTDRATMDEYRNTLSDENLKMLIFLNKNISSMTDLEFETERDLHD